jgi:branched-chain amino acid transport system ATP-binding protein
MRRETAPLLAARGLTIAYGKVAAVREVSLEIREGEVVTIVGPNGAGKTTLLAGLMGLLPVKGEVARFGVTARRAPRVEDLVRAGMGLIPEKRELFGTLSVEDNLRLGGFDRWRQGARDGDGDLAEIYRLFPRLAERRWQEAGTLSGGERQMLAMGRALMARPKLLLLDEPSLGLAPLIIREIFRIIGELRARGVSILLVEQNARAALRAADYAYVMERGALVLEGAAEDLARNERVIEAYLGIASADRA